MSATNNLVAFYKGLSTALPESSQRDADALYFTTDNHRIYLGDHEYAYYNAGTGIEIDDYTISIKGFDTGDIDDIVYPLPDPKVVYMNDIGDVTLSSPADGQTLVYNATQGKWVNDYPVQWASFTQS